MPNTFFISDTHFFNDNIIRYCNRPFANAEEMNAALIHNWNSVVKPEDTVYHLGDFVMGRTDGVEPILSQLNGHIVLVRGNHDTDAKLDIYSRFPDKIEVKDIAYVPYNGLFFVCCHFTVTNEEFLSLISKHNSEVIVLHGHVHDLVPFYTPETHSFNLSADVVNFTPVNINDIFKTVRDDYIAKGVWTGK